jgi:hypothetical protein
VTASRRSRVGVSLGIGLAALALSICAAPWIPATRDALGISGVWNDPSDYYTASLVTALAGGVAAVVLPKPGELKVGRILALVWSGLGVLCALGSLFFSAAIAFGMAS